MRKGLIALAAGTFGLGIVEYVMMSILPQLAASFSLTIPQAGNFISMYAIGVCVGAPVSAFFLRNVPLKRTLLILIAVYIFGNLLFAFSSEYHLAIAARFFSGLPHGAYFGTGAIVASRLMPRRSTTAVAVMVMGMTVANCIGIPFGSFLADCYSWRLIFYFSVGWGMLTLAAIYWLIDDVGSLERSNLKSAFRFLTHKEPWLLVMVTMACNGGAFAMYSYVSPVMNAAGFNMALMPVLMLGVGLSMCLGNYLGGLLSDRRTPQTVALCNSVIMTLALIAVWLSGPNCILEVIFTIIVSGSLFAMSSPMQMLLIEYSPGGELMGGAMVQIAFNLGNAIGAFAGGLPIEGGFAPSVTGAIGALLSLMAVVFMILFMRSQVKRVL